MKTKNSILILTFLIMLISSSVTADNNDSDVFTITPTYTQEELDSMKMHFIREGNPKAYSRYLFYSKNRKDKFIYTFYMANTYYNSYAQFQLYEMIKEFYKNIGIEMDSTDNASAIALSYLKRSAKQEEFSAKWEMSRLLLCGIWIPKDTIAAKEIIYRICKKEKAEKIWFANNITYPQMNEREKNKKEKIRNERRMRINNQIAQINSLIDTTAINSSYTQEELALLKDYFIECGDQNAYNTYIKSCPDEENKAMYTFYMANTHNSAIAQYHMYCMIRDFYESIGKEMDSTANYIALSYLKRSAEQGYYPAELEISILQIHGIENPKDSISSKVLYNYTITCGKNI